MRWMNRLTTALIVLAVVVGPPLLAGLWLLHHPWQPPTLAELQAWTDEPLTAGTVIAGCVTIAGLAWLLLLISLIRRVLAELRRRLRRLRHLPVPTPAQMTASSVAGLAAFTLPAAPADSPQPLPAIPGTPQPSDHADSGHHSDRSVRRQPAGVPLPGGGWIPYHTAAAITALAAAAWLQRRRSYQPNRHQPHDHHDDPDLQPLPDAVDTVIAAVTDDEITGHDRTSPPLLSPPLPAGVLLLTGPGAAAAARGLLVTAAYNATSTVSMRPLDLHTLLPAGHPVGPRLAQPDANTNERSHPLTSTVIALGDEPTATHRWHVTADGITTGTGLTEPHRLCTLDAQTATDLLTLTHRQPASAPRADPPPPAMPGRLPTSAPELATAGYLTLLGGCHLTAASGPVRLRRTAGLQVLAYLAVHPQGATRNELTHAIWPHLPPATISQRLHTTLTDLRRQLRPLLDDDPTARQDDYYRLNARAIATDLQPWRAAVQAMTHAIGTTTRLHACRDVVHQYRGELAAGHTWPWLTAAREQARRTAIDACSALAEHTDPNEALNWLQRAIAIDPHNEPLHHQAANLLRVTGDETAAAHLIKRLHHRLPSSNHPPR